MSATKNYYDILGVAKGATQDEIKKAFRSLARKHHPDAGGDEEKFKSVNEAYEVLGDKEKRSQYDEYGQYFGTQGPPPGYGQSAGGYGQRPSGFDFSGQGQYGNAGGMGGVDLGDLLGSMFSGSGSRGGQFGGFGQGAQGPARGSDYQLDTEISFDQAFNGTQIKVTTPDNKEMQVNVPAGATDGGKLRFKGKGGQGQQGAPRGDLYVTTHIAAHPHFKREGADVILSMPLTIDEVALGTTVTIPLPSGGQAKLKVPAGTEDGKVFRMRGKGAPKLKGSGHGDLKVKAHVVVPKKLTAHQKELLEDFAASRAENVRPW